MDLPPPELAPLDVMPSRSEAVAEVIRRAVLRGELRPGDRLVERELATKLGVSKTPVREALKVLAQNGVVTADPYRGTQVRSIDPVDACFVYEVRILLEPAAVRLATPLHTGETLASAEAALSDAERATSGGDLTELSLANRRFHVALYRPCPNPLHCSLLDDIQDQVAMISVSSWRRRSTWSGEAEEHRRILDAVAGGEAEVAADRLRDHIDRFLARIAEVGTDKAAANVRGV